MILGFLPAIALAASMPSTTPLSIPAIQDALNDLEVCREADPKKCWWPKRSYKVHAATCMIIPPEQGRPSFACRVDETITYEDPRYGWSREHDLCLRFGKRKQETGRPEWEVLQIRDRPCEMKSALKGDPNRLPQGPQIAGAIKGLWACVDEDGNTHCPPEPDRVEVYNFRCKQIPAGDKEYPVRAVCRVNAAAFRNALSKTLPERRMASFRDECFRLDRITEFGRSPTSWFIRYTPETVKCELD